MQCRRCNREYANTVSTPTWGLGETEEYDMRCSNETVLIHEVHEVYTYRKYMKANNLAQPKRQCMKLHCVHVHVCMYAVSGRIQLI